MVSAGGDSGAWDCERDRCSCGFGCSTGVEGVGGTEGVEVTGSVGATEGVSGGFGGSGTGSAMGVRCSAAGDLEALRSRARLATSIGVFSGVATPSRTPELLRERV